ncbi:MAG: RDD family protein, partial [Thermoanaerobaculia bacterium]
VDLVLVAGGPLLVASALAFGIAALAAEALAGLDGGLRAAQILAVLLFLARDAMGGSPGKKLFGLRLIRSDGSPSGFAASVLRNLPLLVPGWNLVEIASVMRRRDGRRPGDRLARTALVEA